MNSEDVLKLIKAKKVQFIDLRFMDFPGLWQHTTFPVSELTQESFDHGFGFDGSSIRGWQAINESDDQPPRPTVPFHVIDVSSQELARPRGVGLGELAGHDRLVDRPIPVGRHEVRRIHRRQQCRQNIEAALGEAGAQHILASVRGVSDVARLERIGAEIIPQLRAG